MSTLDDNSMQNTHSNTGLNVSGNMKHSWMATSKWAMFFAILGFIYLAFSILAIGSFGVVFQMMARMSGNPFLAAIGPTELALITVFFGLMMVLMFFIHFYHFRFASQIQRAINFTDQVSFEKAWRNLRNHFRLLGITVVSVMVLYGILLLVVGALMASNRDVVVPPQY